MEVAEEVPLHLKLDHPVLPQDRAVVQAQAQAQALAQVRVQALEQEVGVDQQELPLV